MKPGIGYRRRRWVGVEYGITQNDIIRKTLHGMYDARYRDIDGGGGWELSIGSQNMISYAKYYNIRYSYQVPAYYTGTCCWVPGASMTSYANYHIVWFQVPVYHPIPAAEYLVSVWYPTSCIMLYNASVPYRYLVPAIDNKVRYSPGKGIWCKHIPGNWTGSRYYVQYTVVQDT